RIDESAKSLLGIINDILDYSKIGAKKLELEKIHFDMNDIVTDVTNLLEHRALEKELDFSVVYDKEESFFIGDAFRIKQVLLNLVNNAIKFTNIGFVELRIEKIDFNRVQFKVTDSGIGIDKNNFDKLFFSFTQADSSTTRKFGGTGLGLSISKQLVELMDGEIFVESELGIGSTFAFIIPLEKGSKVGFETNAIGNLHPKTLQEVENTPYREKIEITQGEKDTLFANLEDALKRSRPKEIDTLVQNMELYLFEASEQKVLKMVQKAVNDYAFTKALDIIHKYNQTKDTK
ncbi:MAG: ATP-binding protein, partial [Arcobacteraceae bacterium]|nr:ATP-binding protein [Arcobacteraceae bacterium]